VKSWAIEPVNYALIVTILLGYRMARSFKRGERPGRLSKVSP
jgi:hypothetical protein